MERQVVLMTVDAAHCVQGYLQPKSEILQNDTTEIEVHRSDWVNPMYLPSQKRLLTLTSVQWTQKCEYHARGPQVQVQF